MVEGNCHWRSSQVPKHFKKAITVVANAAKMTTVASGNRIYIVLIRFSWDIT